MKIGNVVNKAKGVLAKIFNAREQRREQRRLNKPLWKDGPSRQGLMDWVDAFPNPFDKTLPHW
jgi:hypothetical protein